MEEIVTQQKILNAETSVLIVKESVPIMARWISKGDGLTPVQSTTGISTPSILRTEDDNTYYCHIDTKTNPYKVTCKRCHTKFITEDDASLSTRGLCWWCEDQLQESPLELPITREELIGQWFTTLEQAENTARLAKGHLQILLNHQDLTDFGLDLETT